MSLLASVDRPDQTVIAGVELVDAALLLDDGGSVEPDAGLGGDDEPGAQARGDAHSAERPDGACDNADHRCEGSQIQHG
jgi:hypothetical protein